MEIEFEKPICLELYKDNKELGRFMLREGGHTIAAGLIEEVHIIVSISMINQLTISIISTIT